MKKKEGGGKKKSGSIVLRVMFVLFDFFVYLLNLS